VAAIRWAAEHEASDRAAEPASTQEI